MVSQRGKICFPQIETAPKLVPEHTIRELKALLISADISVTFVYQPLKPEEDQARACAEAMRSHFVDVTAVSVMKQGNVCFVTLLIGRPQ